MLTVATFWSGQHPSALEMTCLRSFARRGHPVKLFSYEKYNNLPEGIERVDAAEIAEPQSIGSFIVNGKPNLSHFSDWFRYNLFSKTSYTWIDADMLLLRQLGPAFNGNLIARERHDSICGAIMRIDSSNNRLDTLLSRTRECMGRELHWGQTGPKLLTNVLGRETLFADSRPPADFFPISHDDFWRVLLPAEREWCERACAQSFGVHLWNNIIDRLGVWKDLLPPRGSFLEARIEEEETKELFGPAYPESVMAQIIENWHLRKSGEDLGFKSVAKQVMPSVARTIRHHWKQW